MWSNRGMGNPNQPVVELGNAPSVSEVVENSERKSNKLPRRTFLKLGGLGLLAGLLPDFLLNISLDTTTTDMALNVPEELRSLIIPDRNENYRMPDAILIEALDIYDRDRRTNKMPRAFLEYGDEYLDSISLAKRLPKAFDDELYKDFDGLDYRLYGLLLNHSIEESIANADRPGIFAFSAFSQNGIGQYIQYNPGSGMLYMAEEYVCYKYGMDRKQMFQAMLDPKNSSTEITEEDYVAMTGIVAQQVKDAYKYFERRREELNAPLPISECIAYFLKTNNGDFKRAMWDSTLFLKMLARTDFETLYSSNTFENAKRTIHLFLDEFSPQISSNWLMDQFDQGLVSDESSLYKESAFDYVEGKNFMPINKAGTYYHCMNILTWAATCMDPSIVKSIVFAYYNQHKVGGMDHRHEHGVDKVNADLQVAESAGRIQRTVTWSGLL